MADKNDGMSDADKEELIRRLRERELVENDAPLIPPQKDKDDK